MTFSISALVSSLNPYKPSAIALGQYGSLGMIAGPIWKMPCYNLYLSIGRVGIPITALTSQNLCSCPQQKPVFLPLHVVVFFIFSWWRWDVVVRFGDIGGIVGPSLLKLCFPILSQVR